MTAPFRTTYTPAEVAFLWNAFGAVVDDLLVRNGDVFRPSTVDVIGRAEDAFKLMTGEATAAEVTS